MAIQYCTVTVDNLAGQATPQMFARFLELASGAVWKTEEACPDGKWAEYTLPEDYGWADDGAEKLKVISKLVPDARITAVCEERKGARWVIYAHQGKTEAFEEIHDFPPPTLWPAADVAAAPASPGLTFDARETGTILAALRLWQRQAPARLVSLPELAIATDGGALPEMTADEINALCERINFGGE